MIIVISGALLDCECSDWNERTIFSSDCLSSTGSARRAKLFMATTLRSRSS